ncbi:hypothetical protein [Hyphococcus sp.]|uniref:hypothetical protein n=1 Tax=Hyphococcus sp. TaxID=2038636 RepID=UPI003CCB87B8
MKKFYSAILAVAILGCQSTNLSITECDLNGYSFCAKLPKNLKFTNESKGPDFAIFSSNDLDSGYGVFFYEGSYSINGDDVRIIESLGKKVFGEVEYKVEIVSTLGESYSVFLSRDDIAFPDSIRIFTNKNEGQEMLLNQVLRGFKGCASVEFFEKKCEF